MPKLSIITINLNNLEGLKKTMQSVFEQTFADYEYIIIDGGSTDGSRGYIQQHANRLTYWESKKDGGIYDALNRGSELAKGDYLHHLNSGDTYFCNNVLEKLFSKNFDYDFVFSDQNLPGYFLKRYPGILDYQFFCRDAVPHQATIIKRHFFEWTGPFSEKYSMGGDYMFFISAVLKHHCRYSHSGITLVNYDMQGISTVNQKELVRQFREIRDKLFTATEQRMLLKRAGNQSLTLKFLATLKRMFY